MTKKPLPINAKVYQLLRFRRDSQMKRSDIVMEIGANSSLDVYASLIALRDKNIITERKEGKEVYYKFAKRDPELEEELRKAS